MREKIHPKYFANATVTCACGNVFTTGSTMEAITVEVCSNCHPFYTGKQKIIDTQGRVDRFQKMLQKKTDLSGKVSTKKAKLAARDEKKKAKTTTKK